MCLTDERILALLDQDPRTLTATGEVRTYVYNALGTIGTVDELTYLFPGLARIWAEKLEESDPNDAYREHFWGAMKKEAFLAETLAEPFRTAAGAFVRTAILAALENEGALHRIKGISEPHLWTEEVSSYAEASDDFPLLWDAWWEMSTAGYARTAVQFASCLAFTARDNPLFHPWTPLGGGGPPISDEDPRRWSIYWRDANLSFLRSRVTAEFLVTSLKKARNHLQEPGDTDLAEAVLDRVTRSPGEVHARIRSLTEL
jgi:hypothetical protein